MTMTPKEQRPEDEELGRLIKSTVGVELDAQRGRAAAAFRAEVGTSSDHAQRGPHPAGHGTRHGAERIVWWWAGVATALAACLAVVVTMQVAERPGAGARGVANSGETVVNAGVPVMDHVEMTRNVDGGTIVFDDVPVRMVRQQTIKRTQWFDPAQKATFSVTEPVEKVGYVKLQPY